MAEKMKFIRKNGRIIPIGPKKSGDKKTKKKKKGSSEKQLFKKAQRHVDNADKLHMEKNVGARNAGLFGAFVGAVSAVKLSKTKSLVGTGLAMTFGMVGGTMVSNKLVPWDNSNDGKIRKEMKKADSAHYKAMKKRYEL